MADPMETPIEALIENDDDEVTKTIMAELEKHQQEKQILQEQLHIQHEQQQQQPQQLQQTPQQPQQQSPHQEENIEHVFNNLKDEEVDTSAKEALIIGIICFILLQPSIQNLVFSILPETFRKNGVISSVAIASIIAGSFYVFRKKAGNLF